MLISTKGRYALRVMLNLAEKKPEEYVSLSQIAENQNISLKYLEIIVSQLNKGKMVESLRGKHGGYRLCKKPEEYTVAEILRVTEDGLTPVECGCLEDDGYHCEHEGKCHTKNLWIGLTNVVNSYLDGISLQDLMRGNYKI